MNESNKMEILRLAKEAREWIASEEGKKKITESVDRDREATTKLRQNMLVDSELLKRPFTV